MRMFKENAILSEIAKDKRLNEDFWNPGKYFQLLQDMENIDTKAWNATNDQAARDAMVRPFLQEFWDKYKEEMDESDIEALFDDMEDSNYHTEYRVLRDIIEKDAYKINEAAGDRNLNSNKEGDDMKLNESILKNLTEANKLKGFSRFYNTESHEDYIDIDNYGVSGTSVGKIIDKKAQGLIQIEGTTYVIVSNTESGEPVLEAYSVDYQFPYIFKLDK